MAEDNDSEAVTAHDSGTNGRITLEIGVRFSESGRIWLQNP